MHIQGGNGCTGTHPPWFCRAFGRLPAKEREKLIVDNKLCPFCLLHDKDKPCGARQKPASVACTVTGCKGRHAQKLHELLKDILREEGRVHVLQEDDGWEESDGAWELEETEGMIVGAVRQEDECSWSDTCDAWTALDEETEAGIHQVGADKAEVNKDNQENEQLETEGLLIEGEEREYVLELLLREASMKTNVNNQPADAKPTISTSKRKRNLEKRLHKRARMAGEAAAKTPRKNEGKASGGGKVEHATRDLPCNPEFKGRGGGQRRAQQRAASRKTTADLGKGVFRIARAE
jgi:hypothetical protein